MSQYKLIIKFLLGTIIGGIFLWLVCSKINMDELKNLFQLIRCKNLIFAIVLFYLALYSRSIRWYLLLEKMAPLTIRQVVAALIIGYAVNYVFPARLGELFRAEFCKRQYGISRSHALGTIVLERLSDGLIVTFVLCLGLLGMHLQVGVHNKVIWSLLISAIAVFGGVYVILIMFSAQKQLPKILNFSFIATRLSSLKKSIGLIKSDIMFRVVGIGLVIWCIEIAATGNMFLALDVKLTFLQLLLVVGVISLSTLLPSPPGFLGTMQYACVIAITPFGYSATQAVAVTLAMQLFFFGSLVVVGSLLLLCINIRKLLIRG